MVSLKDISVRCGVSVATVSKALNGHKDVSAATREKLLKAAKEMGYFPNSQARALSLSQYPTSRARAHLQALTHGRWAIAGKRTVTSPSREP